MVVGCAAFGIDNKQVAAGFVLPSEPDIRAQRVVAGVVLQQRADERQGGHRVGCPRRDQLRRETTLGEVDPVERHTRLDRQLRRQLEPPAGEVHAGLVPTEEAPVLDGQLPGQAPLRPQAE